jgi:CDP-6-deoxy-D-xylo-4-hexulose-3-dehydrase
MRVFYAEANYGQEEIDASIKVLQEQRLALMCGKNVSELERKVAKIFDQPYGLMTNSGSSANLLAIKSLNLKKGAKVITPALTFSTTIAPLVQSDLVPLFVDVELETLQIDAEALDQINLDGVEALMIPNLVGNIANWEKISKFATSNNLAVIEDSADTIGYKYKSSESNWADITTTSFYASHVITGAGFGGMATFKNKDNYELAKSLRGWGRRSSLYDETEDYNRRFSCKVGEFDYDDKYVFDDLGYNFLPSEISAAFALVQLKNLSKNIQTRIEKFNYLSTAMDNKENFKICHSYKNVETGWLAFPLILTGKLAGRRKEFQIFLEEAGIQTRTIFTGNILRQPVAEKFEWESHGLFEVADEIMQNGLLLGCHNQMSEEKMHYMIQKINEAEKNICS